MISLSQGLQVDRTRKLNYIRRYGVQPPADKFMHDGKLNLGPSLCLVAVVSAISWSGVVGVVYAMAHLF